MKIARRFNAGCGLAALRAAQDCVGGRAAAVVHSGKGRDGLHHNVCIVVPEWSLVIARKVNRLTDEGVLFDAGKL